ncbi:hypothetical protein [Senegalimassilia faecalis]|uniref:hypothetical protein n=1 Tax=Senegalimassilia faecalis TaxID=2509433 RepID=UPI001375E114|nr:hypothetical protein [Senegalimassilia faecalis]
MALFLDERNGHRFSAACLDGKNGIIADTDAAPTQFSLSRHDDAAARRLDRARRFARQPDLPLAPEGTVFTLSPYDVLEIPVYEGVTIRISD